MAKQELLTASRLGTDVSSATPQGDPKHIVLSVEDNLDSSQVTFKVNRTSTFEKLMKKYGEMKGRNWQTLRFTVDNRVIRKDDSPKSLEIEEGDVIVVFTEQVGGFRNRS